MVTVQMNAIEHDEMAGTVVLTLHITATADARLTPEEVKGTFVLKLFTTPTFEGHILTHPITLSKVPTRPNTPHQWCGQIKVSYRGKTLPLGFAIGQMAPIPTFTLFPTDWNAAQRANYQSEAKKAQQLLLEGLKG